MPILSIPGSSLQRVAGDPTAAFYVMENLPLEAVLLNRDLVGLEFTNACEFASRYFLEHFTPEFRAQGEDIAELMVLSKGMYYWFHNAFAAVFGKNLPVNFVATRRVDVQGEAVTVEVPYYNFDSPAGTLILGDTIASGETICTVLRAYLTHCELRELFVFSVAGTHSGARRIAEFCHRHGIKLTIVFGLAAFGLGLNGFDLSFLHPETITRPEYRERFAERYRGVPLSAAGWDFGSQAQAPRKYRVLSWLEAARWGVVDEGILGEIEPPDSLALVRKEEAAFRLLPQSKSQESSK